MSSTGDAPRKLTAEELDAFMQAPVDMVAERGLSAAEAWDPTPYLDAAAVLVAFDPFQLRPVGRAFEGGAPEDLLDRLAANSESIVDGPQRGLWRLTFPQRRAALRRLANREMMRQALDANPSRIFTPIQRMFERLVDREPLDLSALPREEIAALITTLDWVQDILNDLPDKSDVRLALAKADLLEPMRRLTGSGFVGRQRELEQLDDYVFAESPPPAPLFVFGPGGVGKSTLFARFLLDRVEPRSVPFAYIDIDRPTVRPERPLTLLLEAIRQLQTQLGLSLRGTDSLVKETTHAMGRKEASRAYESIVDNSSYLHLFNRVLEGAPQRPNRIVFLVDTFEEAQFLGRDVVWQVLDFLFALARSHETFRLVICGRVLPEEFISMGFPNLPHRTIDTWMSGGSPIDDIPLPARPIDLGVLDEGPAQQLLQSAVQSAGLPRLRSDDLDAVIGIVGRNPMCLKLAARLLRDQGVRKLREARSEFMVRLKAEKVQALLYGRILHHVHGEDVRSVAYPGLIVRRITPDVIRDVLATPCGLKLGEQRNEYHIFADLAREAALVEYDQTDGSLRHRIDVRRAMLGDLTDHVDPDVVHQIDRAAVDFYEPKSGAVARSEEIYHRLRLCEPANTLNERWSPEAAMYLRSASEELRAEQQLWLAEKLGITLDDSVRQTASQEAWEAQASRSADRFLQSGAADKALSVLRERSERLPHSLLYSLEAEALRFKGELDAALVVARSGVEAASHAGAIEMTLDLLLKMVVIEETRAQLIQADRLLDEADAVAAHSHNTIMQLRVKVTRLRVQRQLRPEDRDELAALQRDAESLLTDEMLYKLQSHPVLFREVAAELANDDARVAAGILQTLGLEVRTDSQARTLAEALSTFYGAQSLEMTGDTNLRRVVQQMNESQFAPDVVRKLVTQELTTTDTKHLSSMLAMAHPTSKVLSDFREYFRAGVESTIIHPDKWCAPYGDVE
jgi:hypothetical protein